MRRTSPIVIVAAIFVLVACNQTSPPNRSAVAGENAAALAAAAQTDAGNLASGNSLWGVAEAEDEASHRGLDFVAFNHTGRAVVALSIRPDEGALLPGVPENPWSANVLSQSELPDGQRAAAHYEADIELCRWDVRATFADGQIRDFPGINLCETVRVDLR